MEKGVEQSSCAQIIDGNKLAKEQREATKAQIDDFRRKHKLADDWKPRLTFLRVGSLKDAEVYIEQTKKVADEVGISVSVVPMKRSDTEKQVLQTVNKLNNDVDTHAVLLLLPLDSEHPIDNNKISNAITPLKDVEGLRWDKVGELAYKREIESNDVVPCGAQAVMTAIKSTGCVLSGMLAAVIGYNAVRGTPTELLLKREKCSVVVCQPDTPNAPDIVKQADVVVATERDGSKMIGTEWIKQGAVVIDTGFYIDKDEKRSGNVDFESVKEVASRITPVPGGTGPITVAWLLQNTFYCVDKQTQSVDQSTIQS